MLPRITNEKEHYLTNRSNGAKFLASGLTFLKAHNKVKDVRVCVILSQISETEA